MKKSRKIKLAFLSGALLTIITVMLMLGSTMAWFQDTEVVINTYTFGDLAVDIVNDEDTVIGGTKINFVRPDGGEYVDGQYLFEPGATFQLKEFFIKNSGTVDLNYRLQLDDSSATGDMRLLDAMDVRATIGGEDFDLKSGTGSLAAGAKSKPVRIYFHMRESAGNEYQDLIVKDLIVKVIAVQKEGIPADEVENAFGQAENP